MIIVAGKNNIAVKAVDYLISNGFSDVAVVCNQTDIGIDGWQKSLRKFSQENDVKIISLNEAYLVSEFFLSLEFDKIVNPDLFKRKSAYNIHFSDLPKYKGMYTSVHPILNGESSGGVSLHEIDFGIDTGNIVDQIIFPIKSDFRARDLYREYLQHSYCLFINNIKSIINGRAVSHPQDWRASSYFSRSSIDFQKLELDVNQTAGKIIRQIYAYSFREYQLPKIFGRSVVEAIVLERKSRKRPGSILEHKKSSLIISTVDYDLELYCDGIDHLNRFANCNVDGAQYLLKHLAGVNDRNSKGWTPLMVAAFHGNHRVVDFLLGNGALVNDENYNGTSVLMYAKDFALINKDKATFNRLIELGADTQKKDFYGKCLHDYLTASEQKFLGI